MITPTTTTGNTTTSTTNDNATTNAASEDMPSKFAAMNHEVAAALSLSAEEMASLQGNCNGLDN